MGKKGRLVGTIVILVSAHMFILFPLLWPESNPVKEIADIGIYLSICTGYIMIMIALATVIIEKD